MAKQNLRRANPQAPGASLDIKLRLYQACVQQPVAEVAFFEKAYARMNGRNACPRTLREDFAGTAAVAATWCRSHPDREALAVERHRPTVRWAEREHDDVDGVQVVPADVLAFHGPRVDVIAALNFSTLGWHDRPTLLRYLKHARRCLAPGGLFVMDLFGGPDAMRPQVQTRSTHDDEGRPLAYQWDQRSFDPCTARIDCRIHFEPTGSPPIRDAFRYDWRLWTPAELLEAMGEAGFEGTTLWADDPQQPGTFKSTRRLPDGRVCPAWVVYVSGQR